jgi:uncharacterized membrane protein
MYWILFVMAAIVAVVMALLVGGLVTPREHVVAHSIRLEAPPRAVWETIRDIARYAEWREELESVDVLEPEHGMTRWREISTRRTITFGASIDEPMHRFAARILDEDLAFTGEWTWTVRPDGTGTHVTLAECGQVGNPALRFIGTHLIGHSKSIDRCLRDLARHHQHADVAIEDATPRR